ncbi:hypothetical protein [Nesterenkonia halobia]|uniref:Uncharacterized protein n=1 Tax=Nesterenkonia halobia TaxID=37922 RepID=A0ABP6REV5_9MICC
MVVRLAEDEFSVVCAELLKTRWRIVRRWFVGAMVISILLMVSSIALSQTTWPAQIVASLALATLLAAVSILFMEYHPYVLIGDYWRWLVRLEPFEPRTFWGQVLQQLVSFIGACAGLILSALLGSLFSGGAARPDRMEELLGAAGVVFAGTVMIGVIYGFWTRTVLRILVIHFWALRDGLLPRHPLIDHDEPGGDSPFLNHACAAAKLVFSHAMLWTGGVLVISMVAALASFFLFGGP